MPSQLIPEPKKFSYRGKYLLAVISVLFIIALLSLGIAIILQGHSGYYLTGLLLSLVGAPLIAIISLNAILGMSDILMTDRELCRSLHGQIWKTIKWEDIKKIRLVPMPTFSIPFGGMATTFYIDQSDKPQMYFQKSGGIFFTEGVSNLPELINELNFYAARYHIPIFSKSNQNEVRLDHISLSDCIVASKKLT